MKIKINRNILWTETFVEQLSRLGVEYACISPGSRNTPLTIAFANNEQIKTFIHVDERSGGFFGLGIAKATNKPVALVCTSGTAVAEFYPAIIEAYQYRIPLIICTADRPPELLNSGANQTINQKNIYRNHILGFYDAGLPDVSSDKLNYITNLARKAFNKCSGKLRGPVHINFPFNKPFEPFNHTDEVDNGIISGIKFRTSVSDKKNYFTEQEIDVVYKHLIKARKGIIIAGPDDQDNDFSEQCNHLSKVFKFPIIADGASQLRFGNHSKENILVNFESIFRSEKFTSENKPDLIIHFGKTITSKGLEIFLEKIDAPRFLINRFGDWHDPAQRSISSIAIKPSVFCKVILQKAGNNNFNNPDNDWLNKFMKAEQIAGINKTKLIEDALFPFEGRIVTEFIKHVPDNSNLVISNSMPIRDLDYFAQITGKNIQVYNNRGASGIDGITSTALGIAAASENLTFLLTGDLAFYYDLNGLLAAKKNNIKLIIVLINNNGGGIFEMLPISNYEKYFNQYFMTPTNINFLPFVEAFGGELFNVNSWEEFKTALECSVKREVFSVIHIKTNAENSAYLRNQFWQTTAADIETRLLC